ncbi:MAG: flavodoxin domain-containing protein [Colwellia sp.]|nr:flavodoxin domain-containing protein [Colwellia sp.]MCW8863710.1 flavodoxin domain-containing protein [Colwellia sp.]MCW9081349.1 flavodoxin domain-containing protein [Colwellia sp.]
MAKKVILLVASMSGTAEMVAEEVSEADVFEDGDMDVQVVSLDKVSIDIFNENVIFLYCSSTYGTGELPDSAQAFYQSLISQSPDLSNVRYGVIGLGDKKYADSFCGGPKLLDSQMQSLGAQRIGELCEISASSGKYPEETALEWFEEWLEEL